MFLRYRVKKTFILCVVAQLRSDGICKQKEKDILKLIEGDHE